MNLTLKEDYFKNQNEDTQKYFHILSEDFPDFLNDYIYTPEMKRLAGVTQICGRCWHNPEIDTTAYSVLKHSVGVALIVWHFTHDKKQTIAGLLHDIASPSFKHCIDFLNGDALKQESTEEETTNIIKNSQELMSLLKRDNILLEEVADYKIYPIADNKTPRLSADRLEYTFMNGVYNKKIWDLETIQKIYDNLYITNNEDNIPELTFKNMEIAELFVNRASMLWPLWVCPEDTITMYFFADILRKMFNRKYLKMEDLYKLSEQDIFAMMKNGHDKEITDLYNKFMKCKIFTECEEYQNNKFCVSRNVKRRYINPLTKDGRIYDISTKAKEEIDNYLNMKMSKYAYMDLK